MGHIEPAKGAVPEIPQPKGAGHGSSSPHAAALQAQPFSCKEHAQNQHQHPSGLPQHAGGVPVVRKQQHCRAVKQLQVKNAQLGGVAPAVAQQAALLIQKIRQHHFAGHVAVHIGAAVQHQIPHGDAVGCRQPQPRQQVHHLDFPRRASPLWHIAFLSARQAEPCPAGIAPSAASPAKICLFQKNSHTF